MTVDEILKLHELGYTKEEIAGMSEAPKADPEPAADPEPEKDPDQTEIMKQMQETNKELLKQLKELQIANVNGARQPAPNPMTADDVIKDFMKQL